MLWGRKVILQARNANGVQVDVAALRIDARCVRSRVFDDNELEATIRNANEGHHFEVPATRRECRAVCRVRSREQNRA